MESSATPLKEGRREGKRSKQRISDGMQIIYVLLVYQPGSRTEVRWRRESTRPWIGVRRGRAVGDRRLRLRIAALRYTSASEGSVIEYVMHVYTCRIDTIGTQDVLPANVVVLPTGRTAATADFLRYHVLIRVFDGDADRWLHHIREQGDFAAEDVRFVRWIRGRLRRDPELMDDIRRMVERTPLWQQA